MSRAIICDKCKTIVGIDCKSLTVRTYDTNYDRPRSRTDAYFHLCENCFNDFKKFMNVEVEESNDQHRAN